MPPVSMPVRRPRAAWARSLRTHLLALVLVALLPALWVGAISAWHAVRSYQAAFEDGLLDTARALALALDREIEAHLAALSAHATSPLLDAAPEGDLAQVYLHAKRAAAAIGAPVGLVARDQRILFDTDRPFGAPLPKTAATEATEAAFREGRPTVSDLLVGAIAGRRIIVVNVPILRDGRVLALLATRITPERFARLLASQRLSGSAFATLADGAGTLVARSSENERWSGVHVPDWYAAATSRAQSGLATGRARTDQEVVLAFQHLASVPRWTVMVGESLAAYRWSGMRPLVGLGIGSLAVIGLALLCAAALGRRVLRPVTALTRQAEAVAAAEGAVPLATEMPSRVGEFEALRLAIAGADAALRRRVAAEQAATAALRESEEHHRHAVETNPAIPWTATPEGAIDDFAARWVTLTGRPREVLLGEGWTGVVHPQDLPAMAEAWTRSVRAGEPYDVEHRILTADGTWRWMRSHAAPRRDIAGRILRWYGTTEDIEERKAAVAALAESERQNREALERLGEALYALDAGYRVVFASRRALEMWGLSAAAVLGRRLDEAVPQATGSAAWEAVRRGVEGGEEMHLCALSALLGRWIEIDVYPTEGGGATVALRDIDDRRRAEIGRARAIEELATNERYYRALAEAGATAHWRATPEGAILFSRGWEVLTGQAPEELPGDGWMQAVHPEDLPTAAAAWRAAVATGETSDADYRVRTRGGAWRWLRARGVPVRGDNGKLLGWSGIIEDIDAHRRAEAALRESEARFARAVEAARIGTWEWDPATDVLTGSAGREERLMGRPVGFLRNFASLLEVVHPEDRGLVQEALRRVLARETDQYEAEFRALWPDGTVRWLRSVGRVIAGPDGAVRHLSGVSIDVTEQALARQRRDLLAREVDHRAKNALSVVQSVLRLTPANEPKAFAAAVEARVSALARVHSLLAQEGWAGAELRVVTERELAPYAVQPGLDGAVLLDGPPVALGPAAVQPLAMVLHELATNAAKYGALSAPGGRVDVSWRIEGTCGTEARLHLRWCERGGPLVQAAPTRRGFGSRVIEATVRGQLGGAVERRWEPTGLVCEITVPLARVTAGREADCPQPRVARLPFS